MDQEIAKDDEAFVAVFDLAFPLGLDYTEGDKRAASVERYHAWLLEFQRTDQVAQQHYAEQMKTADATRRVAITARVAQLQFRIASLFARAEIPLDIRAGGFRDRKTAEFCAKEAKAIEPMLVGAEAAAASCAEQAKNLPPGWWSAVCKP